MAMGLSGKGLTLEDSSSVFDSKRRMRAAIAGLSIKRSSSLTTVLRCRFPPAKRALAFFCSELQPSQSFDFNAPQSLVEGCDYEHWLVIMKSPRSYLNRKEIVDGYIKTLATALGSENEARRSIYSVSTKYYYAFGCKVPEILTHKIKNLPNVSWVLPDSLVGDGYGGEPFVNGAVVPYDEKYHADWIENRDIDKAKSVAGIKKQRRQRKKKT